MKEARRSCQGTLSLYVRVQGIDVLIFNGMLNVSQVYFAVSSSLVFTIMERSFSFHKNFKYSMFILGKFTDIQRAIPLSLLHIYYQRDMRACMILN